MRRISLLASALALIALLVGPVSGASASPADSVTLSASPRAVTYGQVVHFSGRVSPPSGGQTVDVVDEDGTQLVEATTKADGTYAADVRPDSNAVVHAQWGVVSSDKLQIKVRPVLSAHRTDVRLFDTTKVTGRISPANPGARVSVTLVRDGRTVARATPRMSRHGRFAARLTVDRPGKQVVVVRYADADHLAASWRSNPATPPLPSLHEGSQGIFVDLVQQRLAELHYRVYAQNGRFDYHLADSVMAFHKVQGMARTESVDRATWNALATPKISAPRDRTNRAHFEVDLTKQVVYYVRDGAIADILHVSTGKPSTPTRPGHFYVTQKQPGFNSHEMYYSSFFDGNRALHGYAEVPSYAASHGCVRIPYWNAVWVYNRAPYGTPVDVYF